MRIHTSPTFLGKILALAGALVLVSCGADQVAGIQGTGSPVASGTSVGPITGFGSIIQDGVKYASSSAQIRIDDQPGTEAQLRVGQIVTIKGSINSDGINGSATEVTFNADLRGAVSKIDTAGRSFTMLGQTVRVDDATLFDESIQPAALEGLQAGALVQVSGTMNSAGEIVASRVDPANAAAGLQVKGSVKSLDTVARTFRINALLVDYSNISPGDGLANASTVIVRGTLSNPTTLVATRVQVLGSPGAAANEPGRVEGLITAFTSNTDFTVDRQRVTTNASTQLELGGVALGPDVSVKVRGTFNAAGVLVATRVEVRSRTLGLAKGLVESVSSASNTLTILGVAIDTNGSTSFEDKSSQPLRTFSLADVRTGDYVEVRGVSGANGRVVATLVQRDRPEPRSYLQGIARDVVTPGFSVLGAAVTTDAQTNFLGAGGQSHGAAQFFSEASGKTVRVRGTLAGSVLLADQVQIRD
jgi:hypothetical protein